MLIGILFSFVHLVCAFGQDRVSSGYRSTLSRIHTQISPDGTASTTFEIKNAVETQSGATQMSQFMITLPNPEAKFTLIKAEVKTEGRVFPSSSADVQTSMLTTSQMGINQVAQKIVSLRQVKPGSEVSIVYSLTPESLVRGAFFDAGGISNREFADVEEVIYSSNKPIKYVTQGFGDFYSIRSVSAEGRHTVTIAPAAAARELVGRKELVGLFFVTTAESWIQLNRAVAPEYEKVAGEPLPEPLSAIVNGARAARDPKLQIEAAARGLQKAVTYSGDWRTNHGRYFPASLKATVESGRGDCKDYASGMVAILRKLGFTAHVALSFRRTGTLTQATIEQMPGVPSLHYFNHAIVWAKDKSGKAWWIDPTNPVVLANLLLDDLLGNFALVLDGKSDSVTQLPVENPTAQMTRLAQTVETKPDNSVAVTADLTVNPSVYNLMAMVETRQGGEAMRRVLGMLINPMSRSDVQYSSTVSEEKVTYKINLTASDWVREQGARQRDVFVSHPVAMNAMRRFPSDEWDFGQPGQFEMVTLLKNEQVVDPILHECLGRSQWLDFDRTVIRKGMDTEISDRVTVKKRFAHASDLKGDEFAFLMSEIRACESSARITTRFDASLRSSDQAKVESLKGPPIEKMTDADALAMENVFSLELRSYLLRKLYRYHADKIAKGKGDPMAYAKVALNLQSMGYVSGDKFVEEYTRDGLRIVAEGLRASGDPLSVPLLRARAKLNSDLGNFGEAARDFRSVVAKEPKAFKTARLGYSLNLKRKKFDEAQKWIAFAVSVAETAGDKRDAQGKLAAVLSEQEKYAEAIALRETLLRAPEASPWDWHNAANDYCLLKNWDKCIEYERRALNIAEFGMARRQLADALVRKAHDLRQKNGLVFAGANANDGSLETLYLEAIKWEKDNVPALLSMADILSARHWTLNRPADYEKSKEYLSRAREADPRHAFIPQTARAIDSRKIFRDQQGREPASPQ